MFDIVMEHRSIISASRELGVTASAVSHSMARLREMLDDELFVSSGAGLVPTARAIRLAPGIRAGLELISSSIGDRVFVPSETSRIFHVASTDYTTLVVLPHLLSRLAKTSPGLKLRIFPLNRMDVVRNLDDGRIDVAIGWFAELPERMRRGTMLFEKETIVVRPGHPLTREKALTKERLLAFPHVVVELTGDEGGMIDGYLNDRGVSRRVWMENLVMGADNSMDPAQRAAVTVPHYSAVIPILQVTDMVATLPRRLALAAVQNGSAAILPVSYKAFEASLESVWHERGDGDAGLRWLIDELLYVTDTPPLYRVLKETVDE